jgi:hypothetical protein
MIRIDFPKVGGKREQMPVESPRRARTRREKSEERCC